VFGAEFFDDGGDPRLLGDSEIATESFLQGLKPVFGLRLRGDLKSPPPKD
jgi:hypothetical protein